MLSRLCTNTHTHAHTHTHARAHTHTHKHTHTLTVPPPPPTNVQVTNRTKHTISLTWGPPEDYEGENITYKVYIALNNQPRTEVYHGPNLMFIIQSELNVYACIRSVKRLLHTLYSVMTIHITSTVWLLSMEMKLLPSPRGCIA